MSRLRQSLVFLFFCLQQFFFQLAVGRAEDESGLRSGPITAKEREFWALQPIRDPRPPQVAALQGVHNDVDCFVVARLAEINLELRPAADRRTLLRRASFDLTGLPPTPSEMQSFIDDPAPNAFATVVERLLASSAHGERWGRHWLDVVRYADTAGETADYPTPLAYKYRNWVIDAFNEDKPQDEFLREQIAGDILALRAPGIEPEAYERLLTATGFIAISRRFGFDVEKYHYLTIQDTLDTIGQSVLGLTVGCARCHDHKYDPLRTNDYYGWYGSFASTRYSFPGSEEKKRPYDLFPALPPALARERQAEWKDRLAKAEAELARLEAEQKSLEDQLVGFADADGFIGFETDPLGGPPQEPWNSLGAATITASAQSPFDNALPHGTRGITFPGDAENNAFGRPLAPAHTPQTSPRLYYNIDFRHPGVARSAEGAYRFYLGHGPGHSAAVELGASATTFFVKNGALAACQSGGDRRGQPIPCQLPGSHWRATLGADTRRCVVGAGSHAPDAQRILVCRLTEIQMSHPEPASAPEDDLVVDCSRRHFLRRAAGGCGALALSALLASGATPHQAKAKRVIFLFMTGGVSHVDTFDPKPRLFADNGKKIAVDNFQGKLGEFSMYLKAPDWKFQPGGRSGVEISDLFPHLRSVADDLCVIRSMASEHTNHYESTLGMHCGSWTFARPSIGSWISYGLGTENHNLPAFMVLAPQAPYAGAQTWGSDFLPGSHQGTHIVPGAQPIANIKPRLDSTALQKLELELLERANRRHLAARPAERALEAPEATDISGESDATLRLYGLQRGETTGFGWQCLVARRLAERGVRFVELIDVGSSNNWDAHGDIATHTPLARNVDRPIAALITDLKQRGMLEDTLVVWTTEFGRTPYNAARDAKGREHHHQVFSSWLAGGGVRGGFVHGASDDHGIAVAENRVHVHDFHATILHLLGIDHERLTFRHAGRDYRLTDVHGQVVRELLA